MFPFDAGGRPCPPSVRGAFVTSPRADWALEAYSSVSMAAIGGLLGSGVFVPRGARMPQEGSSGSVNVYRSPGIYV